jgi:hypothetical protein
MGRPSVPSWDDPPFEPYAYLAPPDPTRHTGRRATAQKRPPFQKNDGTPGHRSGQTILRSWAVRRSKRMPLPSGAIRPVFPIVWLRPENDLRYLHVCPLFFRNSLEQTPPHIVGREPTPSLPYIFVGIVPLATPGDKRSRVTTCFPCLFAATKTTIVFEKRWDDRPSFRTEHRFRRTMGRPSIRSWTDPPFEPYAHLAPPDPTRYAKRMSTAKKRPPFQKNDGTPGHRSGQTTLRSWAVRRYRPAQSDPFFQSCGSGPKTTPVTYTFAPCFSEIRSSIHLPI